MRADVVTVTSITDLHRRNAYPSELKLLFVHLRLQAGFLAGMFLAKVTDR